ncbi:MAG: hypothetical protein M1818_003034 [Claussenomyces sp. TS43310]|nr:MAG: hypothetical protein M1818_003034 [Claussenomyces sp. TS43310]
MGKKELRSHLAQKGLPKCLTLGTLSGNSKHQDWPRLDATCITEWRDIELRTFDYLYPELLDYTFDSPTLLEPLKRATHITGEDSVHGLVMSVFGMGLGHILRAVESKLGRCIWLGSTSLCRLGNDISQSNKPDWNCAIVIDNAYNNIVCYCPGDTKKAISFQPKQLWPVIDKRYEAENMLPVRQAAHYARLARSRYAFIVTEAGLTALRISFEEGRAISPVTRRFNPTRTAAPTPGSMRLSGSSAISEAYSTMSLGPPDVSGIKMAVFYSFKSYYTSSLTGKTRSQKPPGFVTVLESIDPGRIHATNMTMKTRKMN